MLKDTGGRLFCCVIIYGFDNPYLELAAGIIMRAIRDVKSGRTCNVDGSPCGTDKMVGVHVCAAQARIFLKSEYAALMMDALGLRRAAVLEAIEE